MKTKSGLFLAEFFLDGVQFIINVNHILILNIIFPKNRSLWNKITKKCGKTGENIDDVTKTI
jgi:hypothetical protein